MVEDRPYGCPYGMRGEALPQVHHGDLGVHGLVGRTEAHPAPAVGQKLSGGIVG